MTAVSGWWLVMIMVAVLPWIIMRIKYAKSHSGAGKERFHREERNV